ncbi:TolC family protein [Variovorax sp. YR216]|uniref:TolC family protein n=1 Tax=Variovorax sp. YR216 TaxID=1882828 RepID=UPI00089B31E6|nr:TolC family protein [Variovorax sp. YR216]SEB09218.1 Outer membrane protein TolC [Variovorax sp. YR216]
MKRRSVSIPLAAAFLAAACASPPADLAPPAPDRPWKASVDAAGNIRPPKTAGDAGGTAASHVLPSNPALGVLPPAPTSIDADHAYTLPELIDIAQSNSPQTRVAWATARAAASAVGVARAAYLPHLSASAVGGYQRFNANNSTLGIGVDNNVSGSGAVGALALQWLLFDFGERDAVVDATEQLSSASNIAFTFAHQRVIHDVCLAFYAHAAARTHVDNAEKALVNAREIEAAAQDRYKHGVGTVIDVAQTHQATAQAQLARVQAQGAAQSTYVALIAAMGISPLTRLKVADVSGRKLSASMADPVEKIVSEALARRPDMLAAYAAQKASMAKAAAAEAAFKPKVFMSAVGTYGTGRLGVTALPSFDQQSITNNVTSRGAGGSVLFGVAVPLYDGGLRNAAVEQARADVDRAAATLDKARSDAVLQIVQAQDALQTSLAAHEAATALEAAARITFDARLDAYRHGVGTVTEVALADTQWLLARNAAADAYSHALSAAATLAFATGSLGAAPQ